MLKPLLLFALCIFPILGQSQSDFQDQTVPSGIANPGQKYGDISVAYSDNDGDGQQQDQTLSAGQGFVSQNSNRVHFGLADYNAIDEVIGTWPSDERDVFSNLAIDQLHALTESSLFMNPSIDAITPFSDAVEKYGKFETRVAITAQYTNPYDYDQVQVSAIFTSPSGQKRTIDGFFMWDLKINEQTGNLSQNSNEGEFRIRFAPDQIGIWTYEVQIKDANGTSTSTTQSFECTTISDPHNKGYIRDNQTNFLNFDNGDPYIAIGENICWQNNNAYLDYKNWLTHLKDQGGNFFRLWHAHWGLGLEWRAGQSQFQGLRQYKEANSAYQDWLFDYCSENGIYIMLTLQHHGQVSSEVNPNWSESPYNSANGGPCQNTWDFFTDDEAISHTKNRLRYIIARWGYSRSIMAWELFNEVEWTNSFNQHKEKVIDWHSAISQYIRAIDNYGHLITTSFAHDYNDPVMWALPDMDITQTHFYFNSANLERVLAGGVKKYVEEFGKPTLTGEFGLGSEGSVLRNIDPDGIHFHNGLWSPLFAGGLGTGMSWWWDSYIEPHDLYYHLGPVASIADNVPFLEGNMMPAEATVKGAPGDLSITPALGWEGIGTADIMIDANGQLSPSNASLGQYLYGSSWNTQYRSPPTFAINLPENGSFSVRTANNSGTAPKIAISLDGVLVLEESGQTNKTYTIEVPAGSHTITVDNTGTDWITISSYIFGGLGSALDAYSLLSENKQLAAGWVLNNRYNHEYVRTNGVPAAIEGAELKLGGFENGGYFVTWYDCLTGEATGGEAVFAENDTLSLLLPSILWDVAFVVDSEPVSTQELAQNLDFNVYPNPAKAGTPIHISTSNLQSTDTQVQLLDMGGKRIAPQAIIAEGNGEMSLQLPGHLPAGMYWLRMATEGKVGARPIVIGE